MGIKSLAEVRFSVVSSIFVLLCLFTFFEIYRVVESGRAFLKGFGREDFATREPFFGNEDAERIYRSFGNDETYIAAADKLRKGTEFANQARLKEKEFLKITPFDHSQPLAQKINVMTYYEEMLECENYWEDNSRMSLNKANPSGEKTEIGKMARWCWTQRYFKLAEAAHLGQELLQFIRQDLFNSERTHPKVFLHSAHDYTMMTLFRAMGMTEYFPQDQTMGFCSFIMFKSDGTICFNPRPFQHDCLESKVTVRNDDEIIIGLE